MTKNSQHPCADASFRFYDDASVGTTMETEIDVVQGRETDATTWVQNHLGARWSVEVGDVDNAMTRFFLSTNVSNDTNEQIAELQKATFTAIANNEQSPEAKGLPFFQPVYVL